MSDTSGIPIIAVDAMGGDIGPPATVPGAVQALESGNDYALHLYGDPDAIAPELAKLDIGDLPVTTVPCTQNIDMCEAPTAAIRGKPDSPIVRAMRDQKAGRVQAVVSAGSTGAMVAASLLILGRLASVDRPAIATLIPTSTAEFLLLDVGANVQATPQQLLSFARMGDLYAREMLGLDSPRVGLLNIGEEEAKGSELTTSAYRLFGQGGFRFAGNVEANRLLRGAADVVVTDGFTGNVTLKLIEGIELFLRGVAENPALSTDERALVVPALGVLKQRCSYEAYGGALLLGINGVSIISHGRSSSLAISNAVRVAGRQVELRIPDKLQAMLAATT